MLASPLNSLAGLVTSLLVEWLKLALCTPIWFISASPSIGTTLAECNTSHVTLIEHLPHNIAQTQNIIVEVGSLVYVSIAAYGKDEMIRYLQSALPVFQWGPQSSQALLNLIHSTNDTTRVSSGQTVVQFREAFKKIFRDCRRWQSCRKRCAVLIVIFLHKKLL